MIKKIIKHLKKPPVSSAQNTDLLTQYVQNFNLFYLSSKPKSIFVFPVISQHWDGAGSWNHSPWKTRTCLIRISQYHGCWCLGDASHQGISSHGIDPVFLEYTRFSTGRVTIQYCGSLVPRFIKNKASAASSLTFVRQIGLHHPQSMTSTTWAISVCGGMTLNSIHIFFYLTQHNSPMLSSLGIFFFIQFDMPQVCYAPWGVFFA